MFKAIGADENNIITDKQSGADLQRTGYLYLKYSLLRKGDTLIICSLDRLSRDKKNIQKEVQYFKENEIRLKVLDIPHWWKFQRVLSGLWIWCRTYCLKY